MHDPVAQARANLDQWMSRRWRRGESAHWRKFNPRIASLDDLTTFRARNATGSDSGLGLDDARAGQATQTQRVLDELSARWGLDAIRGLAESSVGSPPTTRLLLGDGSGIEVDFNDVHLINFALGASRSLRLTGRDNPSIIWEIGGGYGGTAAKLAWMFPSAQFVLTDLPPALLLQAFYLDRLFPGHVSVLPLGLKMGESTQASRFVLCTADAIDFQHESLDGVLNTRSFGEMTRPVVRRYFAHIENALSPEGIFVNVNRLQKIGFRFTEYPYDDRWQVLESEPAFGQPSLWSLITRRTSGAQPDFARWRESVQMPPMPSLRKRLVAQARRLAP